MNPGSTRSFYQARRVLLILGCAAPLILLAGAWWLVTQVLMLPSVPDGSTSPEDVARFIIHEKGLPRLTRERAERVFREQVRRLGADSDLRERFLREIRISTPDEQKAFRMHVLGFLRPMLLKDIEDFEATPQDARRAYLDDRIVEYNRIGAALGKTELAPDVVAALQPTREEAWDWVLKNTTPRERELVAGYQAALATRVQEILADPDLERELRRQVQEQPP